MKLIVEDELKNELLNLNCKWLLDDCKKIIEEIGLKELSIEFTQIKGKFGENTSKLIVKDDTGKIVVIKDYNFGNDSNNITFKYSDGILSR